MKIIQIVFAIVITMFVSVSHAGLLKLNVENGILLGADNVDVNGKFYNVSFLDGTCVDLFGGCDDVSDFAFNTEADAVAASRALLAQVFVDGINGQFDSAPELTNGCANIIVCVVFTPYGIDISLPSNLEGLVVAARNAGPGSVDGVFVSGLDRGGDGDRLPVFAVWNPTKVSSPNVAFIMVMGIAGLLVSQRRRQV